jgi:diguanylate cyclase (GGDEF)-like protein
MGSAPLDKVLGCPNLPSLPAVAVELLDLLGDPETGIPEVAKVVQRDTALAARVLKTINSSYYGLSKPVVSIDRAMTLLGMNAVKSLVLGFSLAQSSKGVSGADLDSYWKRSIFEAVASREIATAARAVDPDEAFVASMFQDMGMLACTSALGVEYAAVVSGQTHEAAARLEQEAFGFDHAKVGGKLAEKWKLPASLIEVIAKHHRADGVVSEHRDLVRIARLGGLVASVMLGEAPNSAKRDFEESAGKWFVGATLDLGAIVERVAEASKTFAKMLEQDIGPAVDVTGVMARAQEQSFEHQMHLQREAEELARAALTDGLTGVANRKAFDKNLAEHFARWQSGGTPLAVLFMDADKFKSVNDTYGHGVGDAVLIELARRCAATVGQRGIVHRYGGEEFAVILPGMKLDDAVGVGEQLRGAIETPEFSLGHVEGGPQSLKRTASVGVSAVDAGPPSRLTSGEKITQEADEAVYAAKNAGRNVVKVWGRLRDSDADKGPAPGGVGCRVLLVEDDPLSATLVRTLMRKRPGVQVDWVLTVESAEQRIRETRPDVVVMDHQLGERTGAELVLMLKASPLGKAARVIVLSADTRVTTRDRYVALGVDAYMTKEEIAADMSKLNAQIAALIEPANGTTAEPKAGATSRAA